MQIWGNGRGRAGKGVVEELHKGRCGMSEILVRAGEDADPGPCL